MSNRIVTVPFAVFPQFPFDLQNCGVVRKSCPLHVLACGELFLFPHTLREQSKRRKALAADAAAKGDTHFCEHTPPKAVETNRRDHHVKKYFWRRAIRFVFRCMFGRRPYERHCACDLASVGHSKHLRALFRAGFSIGYRAYNRLGNNFELVVKLRLVIDFSRSIFFFSGLRNSNGYRESCRRFKRRRERSLCNSRWQRNSRGRLLVDQRAAHVERWRCRRKNNRDCDQQCRTVHG